MYIRTAGLLVAAILFSFFSRAQSVQPVRTGKEIFTVNCVRCHGTDGTKAKWGAKDLSKSSVPDDMLTSIITRGKGMMPAWKKSLTEQEIQAVKDYVKTLRQ